MKVVLRGDEAPIGSSRPLETRCAEKVWFSPANSLLFQATPTTARLAVALSDIRKL
jgi:hypothetical protein